MYIKNVLLASAFALSTIAAPIPDCPDEDNNPVNPTPAVTAAQLTAIAPETASCSGAPFPEECADATQAATALSAAFETYQITTPGEQAAIIAYELFESANFKYNKNHFPGRPGQGTRMMAMPPFVELYATAVAGADAVTQAKAAGGDAGLNAVLALVNGDDEKSFGSAAWFVSTQCSADVRAGLVAGTEEGWHAFLTECVQTTADPTRDPAWVAASGVIKAAN
ncbi:hypothetical protein BDW02DRAFT_384759 [Decorospora gaudefroyi]|uniref:Uncharacterized protein n=1 Tax=Decorospora gaudefroyi TaxID=184978 RepID=A0A6A5KFL0_9PLEO|nr:hypothetical protein BDW02DRAFT_384759 [Decorospora gaudefroyi]